ncbi:MAG: sulfurtransferase TusA family protein [bacterium]
MKGNGPQMPEFEDEIDLVGVPCPQNSVRVLLKLEGMSASTVLKITMDNGEAFKNATEAITEERHKIIYTDTDRGHRIIFVKKGN